jgi:uncharacterized protein YegL
MQGHQIEDAKHAATLLIEQLNLDTDRIGLVSFASKASLDYPLGRDRAAAMATLSNIKAGGGTNMPAGIVAAHDELTNSQHNVSRSKVIVLLSDGKVKEKGDEALADARSVKDDGIRIITIGLGRDAEADLDLLRAIASSEQDAYYQPTSAQLMDTFIDIAQHIHACGVSILPTPPSQATSTPLPVFTSTLVLTPPPIETPTSTSPMPTDILPSVVQEPSPEPGATEMPAVEPDATP